jgi:ABC-2 type transport system permease protein
MKAFLAFCKKEFLENLRSYRLLIMLAVFIFFGIMNPLTAKLLPDLLNGSDIGGTILTMPEPTAMDSWAQFFKNNGQMGVLVLIIVFCGITANEFSRGTLVNILTKGMKRHTVILSKLTVASTIWTASYLASLATTYGYTRYLWEIVPMPHAFFAFASPWLYGLLLIALMVLGGVWFKTTSGSLLLTGGVVISMSLLNISPRLQRYNPISLAGDTLNLLSGQKVPDDFVPAFFVCLVLIGFLVAVSVLLFNRREV